MKPLFAGGHAPMDAEVRRLHPVHGATEIWFVLNRERNRADRMGHPLSLVIFGIEEGNEKAMRLLARILATRVRITDEIGRVGDGSMSVVLPDTPSAGAGAMAARIARIANESGMEVDYEIYSYPQNQREHGSGDAAAAGADRRRRTPAGEAIAAKPASRVAVPPVNFSAASLEKLLALRHPKWKRVLDVVGSLALLLATGPVLLLSMLLIKLTSPGPAIFRQQRAGHGGRPFTIYKLRTMTADAEKLKAALQVLNQQDGPAFKIRRDPRITRVGRFLRSTSIDELPQLWNVLKGDMSLVGPRPLPITESDACQPWHRQRLSVMPGLTCIWQVRGRSRVTFNEWMRMDVQYIRGLSLIQDLKLLLQTVPAVAIGSGAH